MNNQPIKRLMIFCEPCNFKKIIEAAKEPEDLTLIATTKIQGKIPALDPATNKTANYPFVDRKKMYKCPQCGRGIRARELLAPYAKTMQEIDQKLEQQRIEADKIKRIEDGKPLEKQEEPKFSG